MSYFEGNLPDVAGDRPTGGRIRRRENLRAFQASLLARMAASDNEALRQRRLAVTIGRHHCLIQLAEAGELLPLAGLALTRVPTASAWFRGLLNIRGNLVGITDLAALAGDEPQTQGAGSHALVPAPGLAPHCGLLLSSVQGLRDISEMTRISKFDEHGFELLCVSERYKDGSGTEWHEIGLSALTKHSAFLHIGR